MKNIIVPVDFSEDSINALHHAIIIANRFEANILMIHVKKKKSFYTNTLGIEAVKEEQDSHIVAYFEEIIKKNNAEAKFPIQYILRKGKIYQEIITQAKASDSFLIIMGTHGISGFEERWIGSNAFKVVSNSPCPVITIRMDYMLMGFKNIVIPIDDTDETRQKVPFICDFAKKFNAEVFIATVRESNKNSVIEKLTAFTKQVEKHFEDHGIIYHTEHLTGNNLADLTVEYALSVGGQLIGAMTEQSESPKNIWLGPYAQQLVNHSPIPVISFQPF
ncbi:MAG: universal stress protein [Chlorobi bacterium]|nr:universal stress protein [Chlorobiota bacterium]